jgi:hypothetical protein
MLERSAVENSQLGGGSTLALKMFQGDPPNVEALERRVIAALADQHASPHDAVNAFSNLIVLALGSISCVDCRRIAIKHLADALVGMLATADELAADIPDEPGHAPEQAHLH